MRTFEAKTAKREQVPLIIGLVGPSGGGKTGSALELATGIQEIVGGDIFFIDTEARRALHYAEMQTFSESGKRFVFKHVPFSAPFSPADYVSAIKYSLDQGAKTIVVDSFSHEHSGAGGVMEMHDEETNRLAGLWKVNQAKASIPAWNLPKQERTKLLNFILQAGVNFIFCYRAKEKIKIVSGKDPVQLGWQPIAGEEYVFEATLNCLLPPGANGVPEWEPAEKAERQMIKLPQQFRPILTPGRPLSIAVGRELAQWAQGGSSTVQQPTQKPVIQPTGQATIPTPETQRMAELQDYLDKYESRLKPQGVVMSRAAIANRDDKAVTSCLSAIRPVVVALKADDAAAEKAAADAFDEGGRE